VREDLPSLVSHLSRYVVAAVKVYGSGVLVKGGDEAPATTVAVGRILLQRIFGTQDSPAPPEAIVDLAGEPHDLDLQAGLRVAIRKVLAADPPLAHDISAILADRSIDERKSSESEPAADHNLSKSAKSVFISYAREDVDVAHQLTVALERAGFEPWLDAQELGVRSELLQGIASSLSRADYFALLLSRAAMTKPWVNTEMRMALTREIAQGRPRVLVLLVQDCQIPDELAHKVFLDFRGRFDAALTELISELNEGERSIVRPKQTVLAEIVANADPGLWDELAAGPGRRWGQGEAANLIRDLRSDELEAAIAVARPWNGTMFKMWESTLVRLIRAATDVSEAGARRIVGRLAELGFLQQATDLDYSRRSNKAWRKAGILWILQRAAERTDLFPILAPSPVPDDER
jgi:hypothetical protein